MTKILSYLLVLLLLFSCSNRETQKQQPEHSSLKPQFFILELPQKLHEISGLMVFDDLFWGFNDSGGKNMLYGFNKAGEIKREIEIENAKNKDWESITQDKKYIYIGDFGNNSGGRKNLRIYKIKKEDIKKGKEQKVDAQKIGFKYAQQEKFAYFNNTTPFDCEAMVEFKGSLYLFSKNWQDKTTTVYRIPTKKGDYEIHPIDTFDVKCLITGADISPDKSKLVLVGYEKYQSYMWLFSDFPNDNYFKGESQFFVLNKMQNAQTEGICFYGNNSVLVSSERTSAFKQQIFRFDLIEENNGTH